MPSRCLAPAFDERQFVCRMLWDFATQLMRSQATSVNPLAAGANSDLALPSFAFVQPITIGRAYAQDRSAIAAHRDSLLIFCIVNSVHLNVKESDLHSGVAVAAYLKKGWVHNLRQSEQGKARRHLRVLLADLMTKSTEVLNHER
jgi:hypothetical protein